MKKVLSPKPMDPYHWPITIESQKDGGHSVTWRGTQVDIYIKRLSSNECLVSIPGFRKSGIVPLYWSRVTAFDIQTYCGIDNRIDAVSIAAAITTVVGQTPSRPISNISRSTYWNATALDYCDLDRKEGKLK